MPHEYTDDEDREPPYNSAVATEQGVNAGGGYSVPGASGWSLRGYKSTAVMLDGHGGAVSVEVGWTHSEDAAGIVMIETKAQPTSDPSTLFFVNQGDTLDHVTLTGGGNVDYSVVESNQLPLAPKKAAVPNCALLGSANGTTTLVIPLTAAVPHDGILLYIYCASTIGNRTDNNSADTGAVDSQGHGPWTTTAGGFIPPRPMIGITRQDDGATAPNDTSIVGAGCRACVAGDLGIGDTVTVTFGSSFPALFHSAGLVVWLHGFLQGIANNGNVRYGEGDSYPDFSALATQLAWYSDGYPPGSEHADRDALMITAMGAVPAVAGFSPFSGTKIGELASGLVSIAAACTEVPVGDLPEPGGTWPAGALQLMGNFQLVWPRSFS